MVDSSQGTTTWPTYIPNVGTFAKTVAITAKRLIALRDQTGPGPNGKREALAESLSDQLATLLVHFKQQLAQLIGDPAKGKSLSDEQQRTLDLAVQRFLNLFWAWEMEDDGKLITARAEAKEKVLALSLPDAQGDRAALDSTSYLTADEIITALLYQVDLSHSAADGFGGSPKTAVVKVHILTGLEDALRSRFPDQLKQRPKKAAPGRRAAACPA